MENILTQAVRVLREALNAKAGAFSRMVMAGRTHLQHAAPIALGQVNPGWVSLLDKPLGGVGRSLPDLCALAIGGTAVGNGLNADPRFGKVAAGKIAAETGMPFNDKFMKL
jgi:fumarate hydratase class II